MVCGDGQGVGPCCWPAVLVREQGHGDGQTTKYFAINQYNPISTG